jgi:hypothetical protein
VKRALPSFLRTHSTGSRRTAAASLIALLLLACGTSSQAPSDAGADGPGHDAAKSEAGVDAGPPRHIGCVDRVGRPAMIFALLPGDTFPADGGGGIDAAGGVRNAYNCTDAFLLTGGGPIDVNLGKDFAGMLSRLDALDGKMDWPSPSPLAAPFTTDVLLIDPSKPFSPTSYLDIEYSTFALTPSESYASCGGRWLGEDAIDKTLSILVKKSLTGVSSKVSGPTHAPTLTFPYLAPPN